MPVIPNLSAHRAIRRRLESAEAEDFVAWPFVDSLYDFTQVLGKPIATMNNTAWQSARVRAGLAQVRVHDLKHTFGRRLRAAGERYGVAADVRGLTEG